MGLLSFRIGKAFLRMARTIDMKLLANDPRVNAVELSQFGAHKGDPEPLLRESDCGVPIPLLNEATRHLASAREFALTKPTAHVNVSRGPVIDEPALIQALRAGGIAGAAVDVFGEGPAEPANSLRTMDDVIVPRHSLCGTDEYFRSMATTGLAGVVDAPSWRVPEFLVDREVVDHPRVQPWRS